MLLSISDPKVYTELTKTLTDRDNAGRYEYTNIPPQTTTTHKPLPLHPYHLQNNIHSFTQQRRDAANTAIILLMPQS